MLEALLNGLDFRSVRDLYDQRINLHRELTAALGDGKVDDYVNLALGITNRYGNFSASEHGLGPLILAHSPAQRVFDLAEELVAAINP